MKQQIIESVCAHFRTSLAEVMGRDRRQDVSDARAALSFYLHKHCRMSFFEIAHLFERKNQSPFHAAAMRYCKVNEFTRKILDDKIDAIVLAH